MSHLENDKLNDLVRNCEDCKGEGEIEVKYLNDIVIQKCHCVKLLEREREDESNEEMEYYA